MGFAMFVATMLAISLMSTTKESRATAYEKNKGKYAWLWYVNAGLILSFILF